MKTFEIETRNALDDPLPSTLLRRHAEVRLIAASRAEIESLVAVLVAALGDAVSFDAPMPARRGWRVYGAVSLQAASEGEDE